MADRTPGNNEIGVLQKQIRGLERRIEALEADAARIDAIEDRLTEPKKVRA